MRTRSSTRRRTERGLTLIEMLVALVLLGLVMTLVSQAMFQAAQIARAADDSTRTLTQRWAGGWGLAPLVANLAAPLEQPEPWFEGSPQRIAGWSTAPLSGAGSGVERFELSFRADPDEPTRSQLVSRPAGLGAAVEVVAVFPGRAEFAFVGRARTSGATWPLLAQAGAARDTLDAEQLPRAIEVRDAATGVTLMRYSFPGESARPVAPGRPFWEVQP